MAGDLRHDVGGGAEAVDPDPLGVCRHAIRPMANQAGTEQRRRVGVVIFLRQPEAEAVIGNHVVGIAAVDRAAGEAGEHRKGSPPLRGSSGICRRSSRATAPRPVRPCRARRRPHRGRRFPRRSHGRERRDNAFAAARRRRTCRSVRHTPQARTRMRTSPCAGTGTARSSSRSLAPGPSITIARMAGRLARKAWPRSGQITRSRHLDELRQGEPSFESTISLLG